MKLRFFALRSNLPDRLNNYFQRLFLNPILKMSVFNFIHKKRDLEFSRSLFYNYILKKVLIPFQQLFQIMASTVIP